MEEKILTILLDMQVDIKNIASSVYNIENNELPAIRQQRLIDSNNIAKILNNQTNLIQTLKKRNFKYISNL